MAPFTDDTLLPAQRVTILLNGRYAGTTRISGMVALAVNLPPVENGSGEGMKVTLRFPDAVSPAQLRGSGDSRMLGCSLHRLAIWETSEIAAVA